MAELWTFSCQDWSTDLALVNNMRAARPSLIAVSCTPDVWRLCSSQIPDVDRIVACLQQNTPQLSDGCRAVFASNNQVPPQQQQTMPRGAQHQQPSDRRPIAENSGSRAVQILSGRRGVHRRDPVYAFGSRALRTGPNALLRNEANFPGVGAAELRARKPVTKLREILADVRRRPSDLLT